MILGHVFVCFVRVSFFIMIFLFHLVSGVGCGLWLWHSLDFSINCFGLIFDCCTPSAWICIYLKKRSKDKAWIVSNICFKKGREFTTRHNVKCRIGSGKPRTRRKGNDQEPIKFNSTSCPRHQTGKEHKQLRRHKVKQHKRKAKRIAFSQQMATRLS